MNVLYFLFFILVTAEVPKVYSTFISEDDCDSTSGFYNKPAKGFSLKECYRGLSALEEIMIFLTVNIPASPLIVQNGKLAIVIQIFEVIHSS